MLLKRLRHDKRGGNIINKHYNVIIVGAGIAGLTSAAYLSKNGCSVLIIEKEHKNGGLLGAFTIDGHLTGKLAADAVIKDLNKN